MALQSMQQAADNIVDDSNRQEALDGHISSETLIKKKLSENSQVMPSSSSSAYMLASQSQLSNDVDRWIRGPGVESTGVQNSRANLVQRSTLATTASLGMSGIWYIVAMVLPLFTVNSNYRHWRCSPSIVLNTAELVLAYIATVCDRIRVHIRRLAREQLARDLFAMAMDFVLVVYAVGFLLLSMYQASMIG